MQTTKEQLLRDVLTKDFGIEDFFLQTRIFEAYCSQTFKPPRNINQKKKLKEERIWRMKMEHVFKTWGKLNMLLRIGAIKY